ncbi:MAG: aminotransferase class I/II-fold pyridoxal phosphate-dependent enzyme [Firmicutes bacterium]|nr:aminotransferase class I/II-fold pyridoxal phosphate-dependent enzyme [Bacillota bacterium]
MEAFEFDRLVDREGLGTIKELYAPKVLKEKGLVNYWGAEFEFPTCPAFRRGVVRCAENGLFGFTAQTDAYNEKIVWWMENIRGAYVEPEWIVPTHGTIFALATAIRMCLEEPQDYMIVLLPGYNRYEQAARRMGKKTVFSNLCFDGERYEINWADLEAKMRNPHAKLLILCNPNNPTGTILKENELKRIAAIAKETGTVVFSDEIFAEIGLEKGCAAVPMMADVCEKEAPVISVTSLGKCMSLTGVNHANALIANEALRERYVRQKYADHYGSIDPMLYAGLMEAYSPEGKAFVEALNTVIARNAAFMTDAIERLIPGAKVVKPEGTYVLWVDYHGCGLSAEELAEFLNEEAFFVGDPGEDYGVDSLFYRYNLAVPMSEIEKSMRMLEKAAAERGLIE